MPSIKINGYQILDGSITIGKFAAGTLRDLNASSLGTNVVGVDVVVDLSSPPASGYVLTATSPTGATWQAPDTIDGVLVSGTPVAGQILRATSPTDATWEYLATADATTNVPVAAQTTWTVVHNLGYYPLVQIIDNTGAMIIPNTLTHANANNFTVTFSAAFTGTIIYR